MDGLRLACLACACLAAGLEGTADASALVQRGLQPRRGPRSPRLTELRSVLPARAGHARQLNLSAHGSAGLFVEMVAWAEYAYLKGIAEQVDGIRGYVASSEGLMWSSTHSTVAKSNLSVFESTLADTLAEHTREWLNLTDMFRNAALVATGGLQKTGQHEAAVATAAGMGQVLPRADAYVASVARVERLADGIGGLGAAQQSTRLSDINEELQRGLTELAAFADGFVLAHKELAARVAESPAVAALPRWSSRRVRAAFGTAEAKVESTMQMLRKASQELVSAVAGATRGSDFLPFTTSTEPRELSWDDAAKILPLPMKHDGTG